MSAIKNVKQYLKAAVGKKLKETPPAEAYDLWAETYDNQPDNLMLDLDNALFIGLLSKVAIENKTVADIGCGTGRHWPELFALKPAAILGFDVSAGMLDKLNRKYPEAQTFLLTGNALPLPPDLRPGLIVSTLTLAHIENVEEALGEWNRVLAEGGEIILTDYHPGALKNGGNRTFQHHNKTIAIRNFVHPVEKIRQIAARLHWDILHFEEKAVDETMKHYYEKHHALHVYERFRGVPIIYGMHLKKK